MRDVNGSKKKERKKKARLDGERGREKAVEEGRCD